MCSYLCSKSAVSDRKIRCNGTMHRRGKGKKENNKEEGLRKERKKKKEYKVSPLFTLMM